MHICIDELGPKDVEITIDDEPRSLLRRIFEKILIALSIRKKTTFNREHLALIIDVAIERLRQAKRNIESGTKTEPIFS